MKREDIKNVFDRIKPDAPAKERMLENILYHSKKRGENAMLSFNFKKAIPALALAVVFAVGILAYSFKDTFFNSRLHGDGKPEIAQGDMAGRDSVSGTEDMAMPLLNQFQIDDRLYIVMSDYAEEFGFPAAISGEDIGEKIATIGKSPDKSLVGCEVFKYLPAGCEAVVAVRRNDKYELFRFYTFESYINNQDEDAVAYLKLYGIEGPEDISRIQFIVHTEKSRLEGYTNVNGEITDRNEIADFYNFYSVLKNSSDRYFEKIYVYNKAGNSRDVGIDTAYPIGRESRDSSDERTVEPIPPDYVPAPDYNGIPDETVKAYPDYNGAAEDLPLEIRNEYSGAIAGTGNDSSNGRSQGKMDMGETGSASAPSQGSAGNALADPVTIRIYNQNGVYFESMYYGNIGFISRYEITAEFAAFIENYIK